MAPPTKETLDRLMRADAGYSKDLVLSALLSTKGDPDAALSYLRKHESISTGQDATTSLMTIVTRMTEGLALTDLGLQVENGDGHDVAPAAAAELVGHDVAPAAAAELAGDVGILSEAEKEDFLHQAAFQGDLSTVEEMIQGKVNVNACDHLRRTALMKATLPCRGKSTPMVVDVVTRLIEAGAKLKTETDEGDTVLDYAKRNNHEELVTFIEAKLEQDDACVSVSLRRCCSSFSSAVSFCVESFLLALPMICCAAVCIGLLAMALTMNSDEDCDAEDGDCGGTGGTVEGNATSATRALLRGR